jgi:imidazolonepropionase-like amidohydrolase
MLDLLHFTRPLGAMLTAFAIAAGGEAGVSLGSEVPVENAGTALIAAKALVCAYEGPQVIDNAVLLMEGSKIRAVGKQGELEIPEGFEVLDLGDAWLAPGMVGLHSHVGTPNPFFPNDINDTVYLTNPGLRASASTIASNHMLKRAYEGGVTSVLFIPGSGSNMGGQGILFKTGPGGYEKNEIRNPGSLKLAQAGNPERWTIQPGRTFMNWNTRNTFRRGIAYAKRWEAWRAGKGEKPEHDPQLEVFQALYEKRTQVSTHTQIYQVVLMTITMVRQELGLDVYIDHGSFDGYRTAALAEKTGVPAILGPRAIIRGYDGFLDTDGKIMGMAAEYQRGGHTNVGFNTDSPIVPQEELSVQAAIGVRYGMDDSNVEQVRGLTIIPATAAGIDERVGSLEAGKDADILVVTGDPADPRTQVQMVFMDGKRIHDEDQTRN